MLQASDIVLMLQLRRKYVREAKSLSDHFHHDDNSIKQEVLHYIKSIDGKGVFLVLEGYLGLTEDQRTEGSILNRLLHRRLFVQSIDHGDQSTASQR